MESIEKKYETGNVPTPEELAELFENVRTLPVFTRAPQRLALFIYLWNEGTLAFCSFSKIWDDVLRKNTRSKSNRGKKYAHQPDIVVSIRERLYDLRWVLDDHFRPQKQGLFIHLDEAIPGEGVKLEVEYKEDPERALGAFWEPHFNDIKCPCYLVHFEPLFFGDWSERLVFRYYDCNSEHSAGALALLRDTHPDMHEVHEGRVYPTFAYLSGGEVEARDCICRWFDKYVGVVVKPVIPRREPEDTPLWGGSLILLGTESGNTMMKEVLEKYQDLPMRIEEPSAGEPGYGRVTLSNPSDDELETITHIKGIDMTCKDAVCRLSFSPEKQTILALLTRVRNPYTMAPITMLNSIMGRGSEQIARLLTDARRMQAGDELPLKLPEYFQALFAIPINSLSTQRRWTTMNLLVIRTFSISKIGMPILNQGKIQVR